jgi:hypothetical protein
MYIYDQRKPLTCNFSELSEGELFAYQDGDDLFYLMVVDEDDFAAEEEGRAVVLGNSNNNNCALGRVWSFKFDEEVQPLKGDLKVWAK